MNSMINGLILAAFFFTASAGCAATGNLSMPGQTPSGIALDTPWKEKVYAYAKANIAHPAWGITHSERNYRLSEQLAARESVFMDTDVLFAAAFLHDLGAIEAFAKPGVDHAIRSVELIEPLLKEWGFPMTKWPEVKDMVLGHMFDAKHSTLNATLIFRDADTLDFLGAIGASRIIGATMGPGPFQSLSLTTPFGALHHFHDHLPAALTFPSAKEIGKLRAEELSSFLKSAESEALGGKAL